ncbi:MAG: hypothetical protein AAF391_03825 [Bacteroidota bacterium]
MKKLFVILLFFPGLLAGQQRLGFGIGTTQSFLRFSSDTGSATNDLVGTPGVTASVFYQINLSSYKGARGSKPGNYVSLEAGIKSSKLKDKQSTIATTWDIRYISGTLTYRRQKNSKGKVGPFYGAGLVYDVLLSGTQNRGVEQFNLKNELNSVNLGATVEAGLRYYVSSESVTTVRISYVRGFSNLEKDSGQSAYLDTIRLSIAMFFDLESKNRYKR